MKRIYRIRLSNYASNFLRTQRANKVAAKPSLEEQKKEASRLWNLKNNKTFDEIRSKLKKMAWGRERCMYCEDSQGTHVDHFYPKSKCPSCAFEWENYLLACESCNSNYKRTQFPLDQNGNPLLIDPTQEDPRDHFILSPTTGKMTAKTQKGIHSRKVFGLDRAVLEKGRKNAWPILEELLISYAKY